MASGLRSLTPRERAIVGKYAARHGRVLGFEETIADEDGAISSPLVRLSTLAQLERRGSITSEERAAGDRFNSLFQRAALDGLRAADIARMPAAGGQAAGEISPSHQRARRRIGEAMAALGGNGSIAGSAAWHIIGLEWSVRRWSLSTRRREEIACGILLAALAVLASHFEGRRSTRR